MVIEKPEYREPVWPVRDGIEGGGFRFEVWDPCLGDSPYHGIRQSSDMQKPPWQTTEEQAAVRCQVRPQTFKKWEWLGSKRKCESIDA